MRSKSHGLELALKIQKHTYLGPSIQNRMSETKTDVGNSSFLNRTNNNWNNLPVRAFGESPVQGNNIRFHLKNVGN